MFFYCLSPQWAMAILPILFVIIPWASPQRVWSSLESVDTPTYSTDNEWGLPSSYSGQDEAKTLDKRNGADPWGLCGDHHTSTDCFYIYFRIYARMRKAMRESDHNTNRIIGKRGETTFGLFQKEPASRNSVDESLDSPFLSMSNEDGQLKSTISGNNNNDNNMVDFGVSPCPSEWALLKCLMSGFSMKESLREK